MNYNNKNELKINNIHFLEDSVLWFIFPFDEVIYLAMNIHERINHKQRFFKASFF